MRQLVGRWIFSPGDSSLNPNPSDEQSVDAIESPIGSTLSLGDNGIMTARAANFVRRGTWKLVSGSLKIIVDPPPERREFLLAPVVELDQLTLTGADGVVLVYHRDNFIALPHLTPTLANPKIPNDAPTPAQK